MSKKVLITGGLGFIGSVLAAQLLGAGHQVLILDNLSPQIHGVIPRPDLSSLQGGDVTLFRGDVRNPEEFAGPLGEADQLVHLAAETGTSQSMYEVARYNRINGQGTAELLHWLMNHPSRITKVVLASSRSIYGEGAYACPTCGPVTPGPRSAEALAAHRWEPRCATCGSELAAVPTPETAPPRPASVYAATKLAQEDLVRIVCGARGIPHTILRFQNVYGPGQSLKNPYTGILSIFSTRIRRGLDLPIFEDGRESRDFVHVEDVARAIRLCLTPGATDGGVFNVGSGVPTSVLEVASLLVRALAGTSRVETTGQYRVGDIRHCYADLSSLRAATGFEPLVSLEEGLQGFARWVSGQPLPDDGLDQANRLLLDKGLMK